jgi:hypothetical protein
MDKKQRKQQYDFLFSDGQEKDSFGYEDEFHM